MIISVVINADTRQGYLDNKKTSIGDYAPGGQEGCRSVDFLLEGVKNKMDFFREYNRQCILYLDIHEPIPEDLMKEIRKIVFSYGNDSQIITSSHNRSRHRWYDYIYIEALKEATGDYVAHFDTDTTAFRTDDSSIIEKYIRWLDNGYKYVCYPSNDQSWWASTRFFICKRETLNVNDLENCIHNEYLAQHYGRIRYDPFPCVLEHTLGLMVKDGEVFYPPRNDKEYIIFCWVIYYKGTLKRLMAMPYSEIQKEICPDIAGANDYNDKQL